MTNSSEHPAFTRATRVYAHEPTRPLAEAVSGSPQVERDHDAPVRFDRQSAQLRPSASVRAAIDHELEKQQNRELREHLMRLLSDHLHDSGGVELLVFKDFVLLKGYVHHPLERLLAEDLVYSSCRVQECDNELVVTDHPAVLAA